MDNDGESFVQLTKRKTYLKVTQKEKVQITLDIIRDQIILTPLQDKIWLIFCRNK